MGCPCRGTCECRVLGSRCGMPQARYLWVLCPRVVGSGCRMPQGMYLSAGCWILGVECLRGSTCEYWVLGSPHLGSQAQQQGQCCCSGESSDPSHGQQNTQFRKPRISLSPCQSRKEPWLEMGPALLSQPCWGSGASPATAAVLPVRGMGKGLLGFLMLWGIFICFFSGFHSFFYLPVPICPVRWGVKI